MRNSAGSNLQSQSMRCLSSALAIAMASLPCIPLNATSVRDGGVTIEVTNCDDHGAGSLRDAIALASDYDTIDLGGLTCSTISLTTGALTITVDDLTVSGSPQPTLASRRSGGIPNAYYLPPLPRIAIDGGGVDRVFDHVGHGSLGLISIALRNGKVDGNGGCVRSAGSVELLLATVSACVAHDTDYAHGKGGGVYAANDVALHGAQVSGNRAEGHFPRGGGVFAGDDLSIRISKLEQNAADGDLPVGGGAFAGGSCLAFASTISGNEALGSGGGVGTAGGLYIRNRTQLASSTISGNRANEIGGVFAVGYDGNNAKVVSSTISGNQGNRVGGILILNQSIDLFNSTIAFNSAAAGGVGGIAFGAGGHLVSSIVALNKAGAMQNDAGRPASQPATTTINGDHNLAIAWAPNVVMPTDTLMQDPRLAPLTENGGPTPMHALSVGSPAIDAGSNPEAYVADQRYVGYARVVGAAADIGAFEFGAVYDFIFRDSFD